MSEPVAASSTELVRIAGLTQSYGPNTVLNDVSFDLRPGEVHALLGANGAGKSTLIKVLAGLVDYDLGSIEVCGQDVPRHTTGHALTRLGLAFVHQDLGLLDHMTVSENIALATGYSRRLGMVDFAATARAAERATEALGLHIDPHRLVGQLDQDAKVMVAVARAFALNARAIVLDEVSSSLPAPQVSRLLAAIRGTTRSGLGYVYVTHRLDELFGIADRVTVLRDGRVAVSASMADVDKRQLIEAILEPGAVGLSAGQRKTTSLPPKATATGAGLQLAALQVREHAPEVSLTARRGEIVALCGLVGCGAREIVRVLGGDIRPWQGTAELDGKRLPLGNPAGVRDRGCTYVPGDRQGEGVVAGMSIRENLFLSRRGVQGQPGGAVLRAPRAERRLAGQLSSDLTVRPVGSVERQVITLSGGNQQKVVCGRALRSRPAMLVLDDPTAGVDIGSRAQIHDLIRSAAVDDGATVVFASSDYEEVANLADRALVVVGGAVHAEFVGIELTEANLATASYGGDA